MAGAALSRRLANAVNAFGVFVSPDVRFLLASKAMAAEEWADLPPETQALVLGLEADAGRAARTWLIRTVVTDVISGVSDSGGGLRAWSAAQKAKHPRIPKGMPGAGQFLNKKNAPTANAPTTKVAGVTLQRRTPIFGNAPDNFGVTYKGADIGSVHGDENDPSLGWNQFAPTNSPWSVQNTGMKPTRDDAIQELVDSYNAHIAPSAVPSTSVPANAKKVTGPGLAGLSLHAAPVTPKTAGWNGKTTAKQAFAIYSKGQFVGTIHDFGTYWEADTPSGMSTVTLQAMTSGFGGGTFPKNKSDAIQQLVAAVTPPAPPPPPPTAIATPTPVGAPDPKITAALDVLFGKDPKGHTMARQMEVYGALRRDDFQRLGPAEQSTLLGDLVHISAKSKGKAAADAVKLIHRFTPPGTNTGSVHKQAVHLPADVVAAQTRVADPNGQAGLLGLKPKAQRGKSGDGWTRKSNGGTGPWGQYGAAGLMLRHVDPADGKERFLMVQRGPGISDPGMWQFPGGAKEEKEDFYQGAAREVVEELGLKESDLSTARVHGTHSNEVPSVTVPGLKGGSVPWAYVSIAATVDKQLMPDLSTPHARAETADAKWMTRDEIAALNTKGKLLKPLAGGALEQNVISLFPSKVPAALAGSPKARPPRLTGTPVVSAPKLAHKPSRGVDLMPDQASKDKLRQDVKKARGLYAGKSADDRLAAIGAMQGFDDVPTVVDKRAFDQLLATGNYIEAWRGLQGSGSNSWRSTRGGAVSRTKTAAQMQEEFRSGPAYYGKGMYGNGFYFATDRSIAAGYSDGTKGALLRVLIPKTAKKVKHSTIKNEAQANASRYSKAKGKSHEEATLWDEGRYAAAKGFDMIEIPAGDGNSHVAPTGKPAFNILNRSVVIALEEQ